jgi:hypothetical protein
MLLLKLLRTLTFLLLSLPHTFAAYITFPLYIYPSSNAWAPLYTAIASNPHLLFQLIINPNSGPGSTQYPSSDYITALAKLNTYPNVQLLGYVHISYCSRPQSDVEKDVSTYAGWSTYSSADISVNGIFFDEAPNSYTAADFTYLTSVTTYARSAFGGGHLNLNPGVLCDSRYFTLVDTVNVFEDFYSSYSSQTINSIPTAQRSQSTIIIHNFNGNQNKQASLVSSIAASGISGMYITTSREYSTFSRYWTQFVSAMALTSP